MSPDFKKTLVHPINSINDRMILLCDCISSSPIIDYLQSINAVSTVLLPRAVTTRLLHLLRLGHTGERICNGEQTDKNVQNLVIR